MTRADRTCRGVMKVSSVIAILHVASTAAGQQFADQTAARFPPDPLEYSNQTTVGDIDADLDLDIIIANGGNFSTAGANQQLRILINNGSGVFTDESAARAPGALYLARGVELGDIDGDLDLDMIVAQDFGRQPHLFTNNGAGMFTNVTVTQLPVLLLSSSRGQFGDVDNDGDLDIYLVNGGAVSRFGTDRGKLLINDGFGFFTDDTVARTPAENVIEPMDCIFGDVDGNFSLDIMIASRRTTAATTNAKLYKNNGAGVFTGSAMPSTKNNYSFDLGDFDGDGDFDLIGANAHSTSTNSELLARNSGTGTFVALAALPSSTVDDNDSKFFDYDNDGDLDLIIASLGTTERIYSNNGTGTFTLQAGVITAVSDSSMDVDLGDFNGDGRIDVVTCQGESGSFMNRLYINSGAADNRVPKIIRTEQVPDSLSATGPFVVRAVIYDDMTSDRGFHDKGVTLTYSLVGTAGPAVEVPMKWVGNSMWRGVIPTQPTGSVVEYFVTARDWAGNIGVGPTLQFDILWPPCPSDVTGDHVTGVPDVLAVINAWGQTVQTHIVELVDTSFVPNLVNAKSGDTIQWNWISGGTHSITSGTPCTSDGQFNQIISVGSWSYVIPTDFVGTIPYFCVPHCAFGMTADINVASFAVDVNHDGMIGTPDLLGVINGWGNCPVK